MAAPKSPPAFLAFRPRDRRALAVVVALSGLLLAAPRLGEKSRGGPGPVLDSLWLAESGPFTGPEQEEHPEQRFTNSRNTRNIPGKEAALRPFPFDPNTLDEDGWKRLGLREKTIRTLLNYRSKGGRFREPGDLARVYGLRPEEFEQLAPYVRIVPADNRLPEQGAPSLSKPPHKPARVLTVELNNADTAALIALPGIGPALARRIVQFREKLGGFFSVEQVAETWGLPDSTFRIIRPFLLLDSGPYRKIRLNTATAEELKNHPYVRWELARPLVAYRNQHGPFRQVEDIRKLQTVTEDLFRKLLPYLSLE